MDTPHAREAGDQRARRRRAFAPCAVVVAATLVAAPGIPRETGGCAVHGSVYVALDGNRRHAVPGVAVSNGLDVVLTGKDGAYCLPRAEDGPVFVIKPAGYRLPLDSHGKPRFYHALDGRAREWSYDFLLMPDEGSGNEFSILAFGDPHVSSPLTLRYYRQAIIDAIEQPERYRFGITLGDVIDEDPEYFPAVAEATARLGIPWWYVIGNHDRKREATDEHDAKAPFAEFFGPATYAFNEGKVHFIVLDSIRISGPNARRFRGGLNQRQLAFVEASLQHVPEDHLVVVAMHIPPLAAGGFGPMFWRASRDRLFEILAGRNVLTLAAHTHVQLRMDLNGAQGWSGPGANHLYVVGTTSGEKWRGTVGADGLPDATMRDGTPNGYAVIHFDDEGYALEWKLAGARPQQRMRVQGPAVVQQGSRDSFLYVNDFLGYYTEGGTSTTVEYREPGGDWQLMIPVFEPDPYRVALLLEWDRAKWGLGEPPPGRPPKPAAHSLHLWKTVVSAEGEPGERRLEIRVTETDGRRYHEEYRYTVVP